jgi:hypothetical protein
MRWLLVLLPLVIAGWMIFSNTRSTVTNTLEGLISPALQIRWGVHGVRSLNLAESVSEMPVRRHPCDLSAFTTHQMRSDGQPSRPAEKWETMRTYQLAAAVLPLMPTNASAHVWRNCVQGSIGLGHDLSIDATGWALDRSRWGQSISPGGGLPIGPGDGLYEA